MLRAAAPFKRRHPERHEIAGLDQLGADRRAAVGGIGRVVGFPFAIAEFDKARILDAVRLGFGDGKDHALADIFFRIEDQLDIVAVRTGYAVANPGAGSEASRRIDGEAAVGSDGAGPKRQRRHMSFADGAQTENEAQAALRRARLVGMRHDARVEQRRRFERIFVEKIGADQLPLVFGKGAVRRQGLLHLVGARLERLQQVAVAALEILQDVGELAGDGFGIQRQNPVDDMVGARLVGRVEIARFGRRLERAHDDPRRVGAQIERLPVQEGGL